MVLKSKAGNFLSKWPPVGFPCRRLFNGVSTDRLSPICNKLNRILRFKRRFGGIYHLHLPGWIARKARKQHEADSKQLVFLTSSRKWWDSSLQKSFQFTIHPTIRRHYFFNMTRMWSPNTGWMTGPADVYLSKVQWKLFICGSTPLTFV
jgi:hypothetical protein